MKTKKKQPEMIEVKEHLAAASLPLRVAELTLRALTQTPLLHGNPLYSEAEKLLHEVRDALEEDR